MEIHDLYTFDRQKTGETMVRGTRQPEQRWRLVVHICFFNESGKMLIQHRQPFKKGWSNLWDLSVGGSAVFGESSQQAAARETKEEIGLTLDFEQASPALTVNTGRVFDDFYIQHLPSDLSSLHLQTSELAEVRWATQEEIHQMIRENLFVA